MAELLTIGTSFADPDTEKKGRLELKGADKAVIGVYNTGSVDLNAFKVVFFPNATAEAVDGPSTGAEWTSPEAGNNVIQHGNPVDPTTLAAGAKMYFVLTNVRAFHSLQVLASVASGAGKLKIEFGRS
ncbi:MAG: hypothetical protein AAGJ95_12735 [Cyanobacteria bacterium J06554_11]